MIRKTKIVCTLGPATDDENILREMMNSGMNVARFNFSHGSHEEHKRRLDALKVLREEMGLPVAAMLDTKGPEVRLKTFAAGTVELKAGRTFTLTTREVTGDESICSVTYADLPGDVKPGDTILLDDGLVRADGAGDHRHRHPLPGGERRRHEGPQGRQRARGPAVHALHEPAGPGGHPLRRGAGL